MSNEKPAFIVEEEFIPSSPTNSQSPRSPSTRLQRRPSRASRFWGSCCLPPRIVVHCCTFPCTRAINGRRRPSWNTRTELAISTLRSAAVGIPRDTKTLRFWSDRTIPDFILPNGAIRQKMNLKFKLNNEVDHEIVCEWVWHSSLSMKTEGGLSPRKKVRNFLTHEMIQEWPCPIVLYLHGGAFCLCSSSTHRGLIYSLAIAGEMAVFVPNYRRPPEVSIIDSVDDCFEAYRYLVTQVGIDPSRIVVMGDSAGGALVGLLLCRIREEVEKLIPPQSVEVVVGVPVNEKVIAMPRCGVMLSPWVDLNDTRINEKADAGIVMPSMIIYHTLQ